jgi:hypothetical protein
MIRRLPYSGLLLLVIGFVGLAGYLTGNLDRWLSALFTPPQAPTAGMVPPASNRPTVGGATQPRTA